MNAFLGTADGYDAFYKAETTPTLFGDQPVQVKASVDVMARYFNSRLKRIFAGVAEAPGVLRGQYAVTVHGERGDGRLEELVRTQCFLFLYPLVSRRLLFWVLIRTDGAFYE